MAIEAHQITTDITLEIDEQSIDIADFQQATNSFLALVKDLSKAVSPDANPGEWSIKVYVGSAGIGVSPISQKLDAFRIRGVMISGLQSLAKGMRPGKFTDRAINHSKSLASVSKKKPIVPNIHIWSGKEKSIKVGKEIAEGAQKLLAVAYVEEGTVDGILEKIDAHGKLLFSVYDVLDGHEVKCEFTNQQLQQALSSFQKRVEIIGRVEYRQDGVPVSIKATRIVNYPDKKDIPSLAQMRALLSGR